MDTHLLPILHLAVMLDQKAAQLYGVFANEAFDAELRSFWRARSMEELGHAQLWARVMGSVRQREIPRFFIDPAAVRRKMETCMTTALGIVGYHGDARRVVAETFKVALRFEFSLMDPAFLAVMLFAKHVLQRVDMEGDYLRHIKSFVTMLEARGLQYEDEELATLARKVDALWEQNLASAGSLFHHSSGGGAINPEAPR